MQYQSTVFQQLILYKKEAMNFSYEYFNNLLPLYERCRIDGYLADHDTF